MAKPIINAEDVDTVIGPPSSGEYSLPASLSLPASREKTWPQALEEFERYYLQDALNHCETNVELAEQIGVSQSTLKRKLKKYHLRTKDRG